jgi:hypothetical protein
MARVIPGNDWRVRFLTIGSFQRQRSGALVVLGGAALKRGSAWSMLLTVLLICLCKQLEQRFMLGTMPLGKKGRHVYN